MTIPEAAMPRIVPFALFMAFIALNSLLHLITTLVPALEPWQTILPLWLYPIRIAVVLAALIYAWPAYQELTGNTFANRCEMLLAIGLGVLVYLAWVRMEWVWAMQQGQAAGYNPFQAGAPFFYAISFLPNLPLSASVSSRPYRALSQ